MSGKQRLAVRTAETSEDKASILTLIRQSMGALPPTARRIAGYIDTHAQDVIRMSITELAEQAEASEGSVVGLCRRLGIVHLVRLYARGLWYLTLHLRRDQHRRAWDGEYSKYDSNQ